jgi:hypothetical protein
MYRTKDRMKFVMLPSLECARCSQCHRMLEGEFNRALTRLQYISGRYHATRKTFVDVGWSLSS